METELGKIAALSFLLINVGFVLSESSIINIPSSSIICLPGNTTYNQTFVNGISAGVFKAIENAKTRLECVRKSCEKRSGDLAFMIEDSCFMVKCFKECEVKVPTHNLYTVSVTRYTWFDAAPVFVDTDEVVEVSENNQRGQIVMNLHAYAKSRWHQNVSIGFSIAGGNRRGAFYLRPHPDGHSASLLASKPLDRETFATYNLTLRAKNVEENKTKLHTIKVVVLDENDNGPVFPSSMKQTVFSNVSAGTEIFRVKAEDADEGENANIQYFLLNFHYLFRLLPRTGRLLLKDKISVDKSKTFSILITARNDRHRTTGKLDLFVQAVNEFKPFFEKLKYETKVSEAVKPGTSVLKVTARDSDKGLFGALNYSIIGGNTSLFHIDSEGIIRTSRSLFKLGGQICTLLLSVCDQGDPPKEAVDDATVHITIESTEKIMFDLPIYHVTLLENTPEHSEILRVRAVPGFGSESSLDEKAVERRLQRRSKDVVYTIVNEDVKDKFYVNRRSGQIITMAQMDYEKKRDYRLIVMARNIGKRSTGKKAPTDTTTVVVQLLDVNDNKPRFVLREYEKVVHENTSIDSTILRVSATDRDSGTNRELQYEISKTAHGNVNDSFTIDNNGVIKLRLGLVGQSVTLFNLTVVATDMGSPRLSSEPTNVYIRVTRGRNPTGTPRPDRIVAYHASVNESCRVMTEILRVRAKTDKPQGQINYFLYDDHDSKQEVNKHFAVDAKAGIIRLISTLDYETTKSYVYYVGAVDAKNSAIIDTMLVRITVLDVNDNHPVFLKHKYKVAVQSKLSPGSTLLQVKARDNDSGENGKLRFKIRSGSGGFFKITSSGSIVSVRSLEPENLRLFNLTVSVFDLGLPQLTADHLAQVSLLLFQPYKVPVIFLKATETTISLRFNLKYLSKRNVAKYGIIVQEYTPDESRFSEDSKRGPLTWYQVYGTKKDGQTMRRYIATIIQSNKDIETTGQLDFIIGTENCKGRKDYCNGPLKAGVKYRFQLRAFIKNTGPFTRLTLKDSEFTAEFFSEMSPAKGVGERKRGKNYDAVVYSVGTGLVVVIVLAFLRGFYRLKLDRKRIHEEKKGRISFPVSNPRYSHPDSPLEKIRTPGPARKLVAVNQDKGSEFSRQDEDDGSSPDSALDESTKPLTGRRRPNLQEMRLKTYFNSVESSQSCNSCDHVKVYCVRETAA